MRTGFSLLEVAVVLTVVGLILLLALPRFTPLYDAVVADAAARDVTTAVAVAREAAVARGARTRLLITKDSLRIDQDQEGGVGWTFYNRWPGPAAQGVELNVSNPVVVFGPTGLGWGASNTTVVLRRGSHTEKITLSRLGRVKRW
ncbi:MAG TPA: type II secretion system protein [Gemmatimonadales bacterium]|nr:type II secretion system protein [Gemmatimonadales bacterium]